MRTKPVRSLHENRATFMRKVILSARLAATGYASPGPRGGSNSGTGSRSLHRAGSVIWERAPEATGFAAGNR
jgi:hypothetical protein